MAKRRGARDDAPALAQLRGHPARGRSDREGAAAGAAATGGLHRAQVEERPSDDGQLPARTPPPAADEEADPPRRGAPAAGRATRSTPTSSRATTRGTSACASFPTATSSQRSAPAMPSVVTDTIETFTERGIRLGSGAELEADIVVTATGLNLLPLGGIEVAVDGATSRFSETMTYKGMMFSDVPNLAVSLGYTNASWTLKCDLTCEYVCRLLNHMREHGYAYCVPRNPDPSMTTSRSSTSSSGYVQRAIAEFPKQGSRTPVAAAPELRARHPHAALRRDRRRGARVRLGGLASSRAGRRRRSARCARAAGGRRPGCSRPPCASCRRSPRRGPSR